MPFLTSRQMRAISAGSAKDSLSLRRADLTDSAAVERLFADAEAASGVFPAVVHLVGGFRYARLAEMSDKDWSFLVSVNLETTFRVFRASARAFERAKAGALECYLMPKCFHRLEKRDKSPLGQDF